MAIGFQRVTLAGEVRAEIERRIIAGGIRSGEKLNEAALAETMGVSRGTVREAVRMLSDSGLIEIIANRGAFVRRLTVEEIRNLYDLRGAIFAMACAAFARRMADAPDPAALDALAQNVDQMREAHARDQRDRYYELNIAFHEALIEGARNDRARSIHDGLVKEMHLFRRRGLSRSLSIAQSIDEHIEILRAVRAGDAEAARSAALQHTRLGLTRFEQTLEDNAPDRPGTDSEDYVPL
ncbi:MAG: GntR family transcriptional regulator [Tranquillimonas sp.]|jgi:DNA-binding GntR family transcriptional regulator